jgi:hypothetical protein
MRHSERLELHQAEVLEIADRVEAFGHNIVATSEHDSLYDHPGCPIGELVVEPKC